LSPAPWLSETKEGIVIALHVQPGAKRTELIGTYGDALKIKLAAPPMDSKVNAELLRFMARKCGVAASDVTLAYGETSQDKGVNIMGMSAAQIFEKLISW
jgi:uncharacterized protein